MAFVATLPWHPRGCRLLPWTREATLRCLLEGNPHYLPSQPAFRGNMDVAPGWLRSGGTTAPLPLAASSSSHRTAQRPARSLYGPKRTGQEARPDLGSLVPAQPAGIAGWETGTGCKRLRGMQLSASGNGYDIHRLVAGQALDPGPGVRLAFMPLGLRCHSDADCARALPCIPERPAPGALSLGTSGLHSPPRTRARKGPRHVLLLLEQVSGLDRRPARLAGGQCGPWV